MFLFILLVGIGTSAWACPPDGALKTAPVVYASGWTPQYVETSARIEQSIEDLNSTILSIDGYVPGLDDSRRHYIVITHTINTIALSNKILENLPLSEYHNLINVAVPEAISNPQKAVVAVKDLLKKFEEKTKKLQKVLHGTCAKGISPQVCDNEIDKIIQKDPETYKNEVYIFFVGGLAAEAYNNFKNEYHSVAQKFEAIKYVIEKREKLEKVTNAYSALIKLL